MAVLVSPFLLGSKLCSVLLLSRALRNSDMLSSSPWNEPELPAPPASARRPEPGWAEEERLCLPLLIWSSSPGLLCPPNDSRPRRCVKLLLYRLVFCGLGEPTTGVSGPGGGPPRSDAAMPAVNDERLVLGSDIPLYECPRKCDGEPGISPSPSLGEPEREPFLNGLMARETDGRLFSAS